MRTMSKTPGGWPESQHRDLGSLEVRDAPVWHGVVVLAMFLLVTAVIPLTLFLLGVTF